MKQLIRVLAVGLLCQLIVSAAFAQDRRERDFDRDRTRGSENERNWSLRGGIGFMEDPDAFMLNFDIERLMRDNVAVGIGMQLGVDDDFIVVSPMLFARYLFDLSGFENEQVKKLQPFAQAGAGISHINVDTRLGDADATDFLMSFGAGVDFPLNDSIGVGSRMLVNIIPGEILNERIYFSWEVLSVRYRF